MTALHALDDDRLSTEPGLVDLSSGWALELIDLVTEPEEKRLRGVRNSDAGFPVHDLRIVLSHYPILELEPELVAAGFRHSGNLTNRAEIEADLRELGIPVVVIHGHLHIHDDRISGSLLHLSCGPLIEPPHLVSIIDIATDGGTITIRRTAHSVRDDEVERLPVFVPLHQQWTWSGAAWTTP